MGLEYGSDRQVPNRPASLQLAVARDGAAACEAMRRAGMPDGRLQSESRFEQFLARAFEQMQDLLSSASPRPQS